MNLRYTILFLDGRLCPAKFQPLRRDTAWDDYIQKMEYIHYNPVAAGLCIYLEDYKYSSAKFYESGIDEFGFLTHWVG